MTCPDCTASTTQVWGGFRANCDGCAARAIARSPEFHRSKQAGRLDSAYTATLQLLGMTHEQVKEAAKRDFLMGQPWRA